MSILDPRVWLAAVLALAAAFGMGYFKGNGHGKKEARADWLASVAAADAEARKLEQQRQRRADDAARIGAARAAALRVDADLARRERDGLRDDLRAALDFAAESHASAQQVASRAAAVVEACSRALVGVAEAADAADSEARELRQAWPIGDPPK